MSTCEKSIESGSNDSNSSNEYTGRIPLGSMLLSSKLWRAARGELCGTTGAAILGTGAAMLGTGAAKLGTGVAKLGTGAVMLGTGVAILIAGSTAVIFGTGEVIVAVAPAPM